MPAATAQPRRARPGSSRPRRRRRRSAGRPAWCAARRACASGTGRHPRRRRPRPCAGIARSAETSLTSAAPAASARRGHPALRRVDRDGDAVGRERVDHRQHAGELDARPARGRRPGASIRRRRRRCPRPRTPSRRPCSTAASRSATAAVGEGVGRDVEHADESAARIALRERRHPDGEATRCPAGRRARWEGSEAREMLRFSFFGSATGSAGAAEGGGKTSSSVPPSSNRRNCARSIVSRSSRILARRCSVSECAASTVLARWSASSTMRWISPSISRATSSE